MLTNAILAMIAALALHAPDVVLRWATQKLPVVDVEVRGEDPGREPCLSGGLELRYRFEVRLCSRRRGWFDNCGSARIFTRSLSFDPVKESYRLETDAWSDDRAPVITNVSTLTDAVKAIAVVPDVSLDGISGEGHDVKDVEGEYLDIRVVSECKGEYSQTLSRISSFLTLGLLQVSGFDTGWNEFSLIRSN